jgi:hypothetical protein
MSEGKQKVYIFYGNNLPNNQSRFKILSLVLENEGFSEKRIISLLENNTNAENVKEKIQSTNELLKDFEVTNILLEITADDANQNSEEVEAVKEALSNIQIETDKEFISKITDPNPVKSD